MKRFAIFDFDGTLVDSVRDVVFCFNETLREHGFPTLTFDEYIERLGGDIDETVSLILKDESTAENIELVKNTYGKIYGECKKEKSEPFPRVKDVLYELQDRGILLAIHSNRSTGSLNYFVDRHFSDIDFVAIEGHNPACPSKPDSSAVESMKKEFKVAKEEMIYIGDSSKDIETARNAKIDCLIVKWGYGNQCDYENEYPLEIIEDPLQILKYF